MTDIPAEFYALANAFLFALHNLFTKKALRYSNPATGVISSLLINIVFLWAMALLLVPLANVTAASILIFVGVGFFQPGLTRLLTYKGIDTLGVAITDPIRASTPLFSAFMAIIFLGEDVTLPIVAATLMIIAGIILLSWRRDSMQLAGSAIYLWYPIAASALAGASQVVRKFGLAAVPHPFLAAAVTASSSLVVSVLTLWYVEKTQESWKMNRQCFWWFLAAGVTVSLGHDLHLLRARSRQGLGRHSDQQHGASILAHFDSDILARRRARDAEDRRQRGDDRRRRDADQLVEVNSR